MNWNFTEIINMFTDENLSKLLTKGRFGIEREAQRITSEGNLALTSHPTAFGDKAENPRITTDFAESQIEMITPPLESVEEVLNELNSIHNEVADGIGKEMLWPFSMPPRLPEEDDIPVAKFADSEYGKYLNTYRNGLVLRYGKKMQMISGLHYNFSFSDEMLDFLYNNYGEGKLRRDFTDELYFSLIRNFLRYRWLLIYLFGSSPLCDSTYDSVIDKEISQIQKCCPNLVSTFCNMDRNATSLRVSRFGYTDSINPRQNIYFNSMEEYSGKLRHLISTRSKIHSKHGTFRNGFQIQLNGNILQKESEFYSPIRPKQNIGIGETQLSALEKRGIKYIEVRILDINPFSKLGISLEQMHFMQVFMLFCLFEQSDFINEKSFSQISSNHHLAALFGRDETLKLNKYDIGEIPLKTWGSELFIKLRQIASLMDLEIKDGRYFRSVENEFVKLNDISRLPSEIMFREMKEQNYDFVEYGLALANQYKNKREY